MSKQFLGIVVVGVFLVLVGCATTGGLVPEKRKGWSEYQRCSVGGYFRRAGGAQITLFMGKYTDQHGRDPYRSLYWHFSGTGRLELELPSEKSQVEFILLPSGKIIKKDIGFVLHQRFNKSHPEIPKGMTSKYDYDRKVILYGKKNEFIGQEFVEHGVLKSPMYLKRSETPPQINGNPDVGYDRNELYATFSLQNERLEVAAAESIQIKVPEFKVNGEVVSSEVFEIKDAGDSSYKSDRCMFWQSNFPNMFSVLFYRLNPFKN